MRKIVICAVVVAACEQPIVEAPLLTVTFEGSGSGRVVSSPAGLSCTSGQFCGEREAFDSSVTLTATADTGSTFAGWSDACSGSSTCTVKMNQDRRVTATFNTQGSGGGAGGGSNGGGSNGGGSNGGGSNGGGSNGGGSNGGGSNGGGSNGGGSNGGGSNGGGSNGGGSNGGGSNGGGSNGGGSNGGGSNGGGSNGGGSGGGAPVQYTLTVGNPNAQGTITSSPAGISCGPTCTAQFDENTPVQLTAAPSAGYRFVSWGGGTCTGTNPVCNLTLSGDLNASGTFNGPFDFTISSPWQGSNAPLSMLTGESTGMYVTLTVDQGAALPVTLSVTGLPSDITANISGNPVTPPSFGVPVTFLPTGTDTALGIYDVTITGTSGSVVHSTTLKLEVRSRKVLQNPGGFVIEPGGGNFLLVTENPAGGMPRLVRVRGDDFYAWGTIGSDLPGSVVMTGGQAGNIVIETPSSYLIAHQTGLARMLASGYLSAVSAGLNGVSGLALEASGTTALITDCGAAGNCGSGGRLARVNLGSGAVTPITSASAGLNQVRGVAIESGGTTALVAEAGQSRLLRVSLSNGATLALATGFGGFGADGIAIEAGGTTALVTSGLSFFRTTLATGTMVELARLPIRNGYSPMGAIAIESGAATAVTVNRMDASLLRLTMSPSPLTQLAPSRQSSVDLEQPFGVALEPGGTTAVVTDCQSPSCSTSGRVARINLASGLVTAVTAAALSTPKGIAVEPSGTTALVADWGTATLQRINLSTGALTPVSTAAQLLTKNPESIAIEPGGTTALVTAGNTLFRVTLATGAAVALFAEPLVNGAAPLGAVAIEPSGTSALFSERTYQLIQRIDLTNNNVTTVAAGVTSASGIAMEASGTTALVSEDNLSGRIYRLTLATGALTLIAGNVGRAIGVAAEAGGTALLVDWAAGRLLRVAGAPASIFTAVGTGLDAPTGVAYLGGSSTALVLVDCGFSNPACPNKGSVVRVTLPGGVKTTVVTGLATPQGIAAELGGNTALVTDCGPSNNCSSGSRLVRVNTSSGAVTPISTGHDTLDGIFIESGGTKALVAERGAGRVLEIDLTNGSFVPVASNLGSPRHAMFDSNGAIVVTADFAMVRVDRVNGFSETVFTWAGLGRFYLINGNLDAIVATQGVAGPDAALLHVHLETGAVNIIAPSLPDTARGIVSTGTGAGLVVEGRSLAYGMVMQFTTP